MRRKSQKATSHNRHTVSFRGDSLGGDQWAKGVRLEAVANLAHELRTPVQVLLGYLDALRDELAAEPPSRVRRMVDRMNANANELARIVENIMEFALSGGHAEQGSEDEVPTFELLDEVMPLIEAANQEKRLKIHLHLDKAPTMIRARHRPLRLILANLAVNAVRFTEKGGVMIAIRQSGTRQNPEVEIEVADTGPGFSADLSDNLFAPFMQLSSSSERRFRGVGLGLTVVKRSLAKLHGSLEVTSNPGAGSRFLVRVPVRPAPDGRQASSPPRHQR